MINYPRSIEKTSTMSLKCNLASDYGFASEIVSVITFLHHWLRINIQVYNC